MRKIVLPLLLIVTSVLLASCASSKLEADLIAFSNDVKPYYKPYDLEKQSDVLMATIKRLPTGQNETAEYYAFDVALDRVEEMVQKKKNPDTKYYLILLTDGLDNVSVELARKHKKGKYNSDTEYAAALNKRINSVLNKEYFFGLLEKENIYNTFQTWPMMFYGSDAQDYTRIEVVEKLRPLSGAQNTYVPEPIVDSSLEGIIETFKKNFIITSYSFYIPKGYINKRIRMEFYDKNGRKTALEADFIREKKFLRKERYVLENIKFEGGLSCDFPGEHIIVSEEVQQGQNSALFTIDNLKINNEYPYSVQSASQYYYDGGKARTNSEFEQNAGRKEDAYIMFVLDTSRSLGGEAENVKDTACMIIETIKDEVLGNK